MGVNRHIKKCLRTLPQAFGGVGLLSMPVEHTISAINMLVQHLGTLTIVGKKMRASLEALQLEIGSTGNPLEMDFSIYGALTTPCWMASLWEKLHVYGLCPMIKKSSITLLRAGNCAMVDFFLSRGLGGEKLKSLNRCRL